MIAIDNTKLIDPSTGIGVPPVNQALFVAAATWVYVASTSMTVTDTTAITSPDTFAKSNIQIVDNEGKTIYGAITSAGGNSGAISLAGLNFGSPLTMTVTTVSHKGVQSTGRVNTINASNLSGSVAFYEINYTTAQS